MRIAIDGVRLSRNSTGVTDITISIINEMCSSFPDFEIYVLLSEEMSDQNQAQITVCKNLKVVVEPSLLFKSIALYWSIFKINPLLKKMEIDIFIATNSLVTPWRFPRNVKMVSYIHDLVFVHFRSTMSFINKMHFYFFFKFTLKRADTVWTNSYYTRDELLKYYYDSLKGKNLFVGSGINPFFLKKIQEDNESSFSKQFLKDKYLLFVGTIEPRKNIVFLLELFYYLKTENYHLIIVGGKGWGAMEAKLNSILNRADFPKERVHFPGYVTLDQLICLYKNAYAFISTSFNEGLGLPQLEAMACGCPVICPHNSAMIEVVEGAGITISSWELVDWANAIKNIHKNREEIIAAGYLRLKKYNWKIVVKEFRARVINSLIKSR